MCTYMTKVIAMQHKVQKKASLKDLQVTTTPFVHTEAFRNTRHCGVDKK